MQKTAENGHPKNRLQNWWIGVGVCLVAAAVAMGLRWLDPFTSIKRDIAVKTYTEEGGTLRIAPGERKRFSFAMQQDEFDSLEFFFSGDFGGELAVSVSDAQGNAYFEAYRIGPESFCQSSRGENASLILRAEQAQERLDRFPQGSYRVTIANLSTSESLAVDTAESPATLNVVLRRQTMLGVTLFAGLTGAGVGYVLLVCCLEKRGALNTERFFLLSAVTLSLAYFCLMQPWSAPDSGSHFLAAYRHSNLILGLRGENAWLGRADDAAFYENLWSEENPSMKGISYVTHHLQPFASHTELVPMEQERRMEYYSMLNYLPQALGLAAGRLLGLGAGLTVELGRLFINAVYIAFCYRAIRRAPAGKFVLMTIALLPMSLMMSSSYSYDAMVIISSLNFISSVLCLRQKNCRSAFLECLVWIFVVGGVKGGGFLLLLPLALLLVQKGKKKTYAQVCAIVAVGVFSVLLFDVWVPAGSSLFQFGEEGSGKMAASFAFQNPMAYLKMMVKTYLKQFDGLVQNMCGTELGWLEWNTLPVTLVFAIVAVGGMGALFEQDRLRFRPADKFLFWLVTALALAGTPVMLLSWTPAGSDVIEGLQGRYYLPVFPLVILALTKFTLRDAVDLENKKGAAAAEQKCYAWLCALFCVSLCYLLRLYVRR